MKKNDKITIAEAGALLHKRTQYIRVGLQKGTLPIRKCNAKRK